MNALFQNGWVVAVVGLLVVGVVGVQSGIISFSSFGGEDGQSAMVLSAPSDISNAAIATDIAALDVQLRGINLQYGSGVLASSLQQGIAAARAVGDKLQVRLVNANPSSATAVAQQSMGDLSAQLSNASSQASVAVQGGISAGQAKVYLRDAYKYLQYARRDIGKILPSIN